MVRFYTKTLGLAVERLESFQRGDVPFPSVRLGPGSLIDFFPPKLWRNRTSSLAAESRLNHFCLAVREDDWHALKQRLNDAGITIHRGPGTFWGARGNGTSIYFYDPEGNQVEVRYYGTGLPAQGISTNGQ